MHRAQSDGVKGPEESQVRVVGLHLVCVKILVVYHVLKVPPLS